MGEGNCLTAPLFISYHRSIYCSITAQHCRRPRSSLYQLYAAISLYCIVHNLCTMRSDHTALYCMKKCRVNKGQQSFFPILRGLNHTEFWITFQEGTISEAHSVVQGGKVSVCVPHRALNHRLIYLWGDLSMKILRFKATVLYKWYKFRILKPWSVL